MKIQAGCWKSVFYILNGCFGARVVLPVGRWPGFRWVAENLTTRGKAT
jgi:hypothetical protein